MTEIDSTKDPVDQLVEWVERYLRETEADEDESDTMHMVWAAPMYAFQEMLCSYVLGNWDLPEDDLAQLWLAGRSMGFRRDDLMPDETLAVAAPGRGQRPSDPPGFRVLLPLLTGGGHGPGRGKPGKREFPATWSDDEVLRQATDVAQHPSGTVELLNGDFLAFGERLGVTLSVVVSARGEVLTAYPVDGDGVVQNPLDDERAGHVARLRTLLDRVLDRLPPRAEEPRRSLEELMEVGEWPHVTSNLLAVDPPWTEQERNELKDMARLCDVWLHPSER